MAADHQKFNANSPSCMRTTVGFVLTHTQWRERAAFVLVRLAKAQRQERKILSLAAFMAAAITFKRKNLLQTRIGAHTYTHMYKLVELRCKNCN